MTKENIAQGTKANINGHKFEHDVEKHLEELGFPIMLNSTYQKIEKSERPNRVVIRNVPYTTVYEENGRTEFVVVCGKRKIRIECKSQMGSGSVKEKGVYMLLNAIQQYPEKESILAFRGEPLIKSVYPWMKKQIAKRYDGTNGRIIRAFTEEELYTWLDLEFKN